MDIGALFSARVSLTHSEKTIDLQAKSDSNYSEKANSIPLHTFIREILPDYRPNPLLFNGHLQTIYGAFAKSAAPISYIRRIFESTDRLHPGQFTVDFVSKHEPDSEPPGTEAEDPLDMKLPSRTRYFSAQEWEDFASGSQDQKPMVVILHGIGGSSGENYVRETIDKLKNSAHSKLDFEACVINLRGHARSKLTTPSIFNARSTWDIRQVALWLKEKFPNRLLFGIGFSIGANVLANYIGEEGQECPLSAAVLISNPWNVEISSLFMQRSWIGLNVYSKALAHTMKKTVLWHTDVISQHPAIDMGKVRKARYFHEFDAAVQAPLWGYPTIGAYHRDCSSTDALLATRIPVLVINANDDPVAPDEGLPYAEARINPYVVLCTTNGGGHLGNFEMDGARWFTKATSAFLHSVAGKVDIPLSQAVQREKSSEGKLQTGVEHAPVYEPMRRKIDSVVTSAA